MAKSGKAEIRNTDQDNQKTGADWITTLTKAEFRIPMVSLGRYLDNISIKRLWRSLKQEAADLREIENGFQTERLIDNWIIYYNTARLHIELDNGEPEMTNFKKLKTRMAA